MGAFADVDRGEGATLPRGLGVLRSLGAFQRTVATILATAALAGSGIGASAQEIPGSFDTLRVVSEDAAMPYAVWVAWSPLIVPAHDGAAWAFFSAETKENGEIVGTKRLYTSRFDPATAKWTPATAMQGGEIQFGPSAVLDADGQVHLVFTDRPTGEDDSFGSIIYTSTNGEGGWETPTAIAPLDTAGHQLSPNLAIDNSGGLHVAWQDQRGVDEANRLASAANADIFASDRGANGTWSKPVQINKRPGPEVNASRPHLVVDGDRILALWSIYEVPVGLETATRIEWSTRPLGDADGWAAPKALIERGESQMGGRLLDLSSNPGGGATLVYGRRIGETNELFLRRIDAGAASWGADIAVGSGDKGSFPTLAVGPDGISYVVYNIGSGTSVQVGAIAVAAGATAAGPEVIVTQGEEGAQGRAAINVDQSGALWVVYFHEPVGSASNAVRVLRGLQLPVNAG